MKIAIIGASGKAGSLILEEALRRHHDVTAIVRDRSRLKFDVPVIEKDIFDITTSDLVSFEVVINAFGAKGAEPISYQTTTKHLIDVFQSLKDTRYIVVGGAGSLYSDESLSTRLYESPDFPPSVYPISFNMTMALELLKESSLNWTFFSPAVQFDVHGPRTQQYLLGTDFVILNQQGISYISYADYAFALLDEVETPIHINQRFTAVSENT